MPQGADATTELGHEHAAIEKMAARIASLEPTAERTELVREATERFLAHTEVEQRFLYPAFRTFLGDGVADSVEEGKQQREAAHVIGRLRATDEDSEEYEALIGQLVLDIQQHIERQETVLLPALVDECPQEELNHLGRQLRSGLEDARPKADP
jgi:hypothetical protein